MLAGLECGHTVHHVLPGGVALDAMEQPGLEPIIATMQQRTVNHWQGSQARGGDQQRRAHAQLPAGRRQFADATNANAHRGRVIPIHAVVVQVHGAPHS